MTGVGKQFVHSFAPWLGLVFLLAGIGYVTYESYSERSDVFVVNASCDLHNGSCLAVADTGAHIELSISPNGIPLLQPLDVTVTLDGIRASSVVVVFSGVDIDMGQLSYPLSTEDGTHFRGGASLSVCTERKMSWRATVVIESQGHRYSVPFLFDTEYRPKFNLL